MAPSLPPLPSLLTPTFPALQVYTSHPLHPLTPLLLRHLLTTHQSSPTLTSLLVSFTDTLKSPHKNCKSISLLSTPTAAFSEKDMRNIWDVVRKEAAGKGVVVLQGVDVLPVLGSQGVEEVVGEVLETLRHIGENGRLIVVLEDGVGGNGILEGLGGETEAYVGCGRRADGTVRVSRGVHGQGVREGEWVFHEGEGGGWAEVE